MDRQTVLVLGGGIGGLVVSSVLQDKLGKQAAVRVVEKNKFFEFPPSYPWVMLEERKPTQVRRELGVLKKKGIEVIAGEVSKIDLQQRLVKVDGSGLSYDHLVIALGAQYAPQTIPGLLENSHHFYDLESALRLRSALTHFKGRTIAIGISSLPFKCPAAPYEAAFLIDHYLRKAGFEGRVSIKFSPPKGSRFHQQVQTSVIERCSF
jgi:sulfide:quinone oxidoreductase